MYSSDMFEQVLRSRYNRPGFEGSLPAPGGPVDQGFRSLLPRGRRAGGSINIDGVVPPGFNPRPLPGLDQTVGPFNPRPMPDINQPMGPYNPRPLPDINQPMNPYNPRPLPDINQTAPRFQPPSNPLGGMMLNLMGATRTPMQATPPPRFDRESAMASTLATKRAAFHGR